VPTKHVAYLPVVMNIFPWQSPFGVQSTVRLTSGTLLSQTMSLQAGWVRVGPISWRTLQPNQGDPIRWQALASFEQELRAIRQAGLTPEVVVADSPSWATVNTPAPTSCGAIRTDKFVAFAQFMQALVARYKRPEFNVQHWELGNEVDVDPRLVSVNSPFGCWGDSNDPYYGGRHYGDMLKVVTPAIKAVNPIAHVWIGGLLLGSPNTTEPGFGKPELFLAGVLEAGAAPDFDVVPYHWYASYSQKKIDYDYGAGSPWDALGGGTTGKARYLRQLMQRYGVDKPLFLNEVAFTCPNDIVGQYPWCKTPSQAFFDLQGDILVRMLTRGMAERVTGFIWFTLNGPGWRHGALLDADGSPKPVYWVYQQLATQLKQATYAGPASYGMGLEGYIFNRGDLQVQVLWAKNDETLPVSFPRSTFVGAYTRDGNAIQPASTGTNLRLQVSFQPVYLVQRLVKKP
jgi:hypothetical protein